jgi:hypothetical protein
MKTMFQVGLNGQVSVPPEKAISYPFNERVPVLPEKRCPAVLIGVKRSAVLLGFALALGTGTFAATYSVGPGQAYTNIGDAPWESLNAGDTVRIFHRATPYAEKWVIARAGNATNWIVIQGVPDAQGNLPIIEGSNATTRLALDYWSETRGVVKFGGSSIPSAIPQYVRIENLDIKSGRQPFAFTSDSGAAGTAYDRNAAAIFIESGQNIIIRNCILRDSGNGLFCSSASSNILVEGCSIYDNGAETSIYEHNNYTESHGITFQYNHFGPLRTNCPGNNLKDRSGGCVIRYNWIEAGNRQLDLVDAGDATIYNGPAYRSTFVYGNILIEREDSGNRQICHYGGDSGTLANYRQGTLYFFNNTIISTRAARTTLIRLSSSNETADCRNNIVYTTATGGNLEINADSGVVYLRNNWLKSGWVNSFAAGIVSNSGGNISGTLPGFVDAAGQLYELLSTSVCINAATSLPSAAFPAYALTNEYVKHIASRARYADGSLDIGAFEFNPDTDFDGIPDLWELLFSRSLTNMNATSDIDNDRFLDRQECSAGTSPTNPNSRLIITALTPAGTNLVLQWQSASNRLYSIQRRTNLATNTWSPVLTSITSAPPANVHAVQVDSTGAVFYRVKVE